MTTFRLTFFAAAFAVLTAGCSNRASEPAQWADPMVGTGFHGHTFPGATTPFGAVQLSPDTRFGDWDACSGYHYSDSTLVGFSHTHLSGTGCCDLGDVLFRPTSQALNLEADTIYRPTRFSHNQEEARPGYYKVFLPDEEITAELTATAHSGLHRYTFSPSRPAQIIIDLDHLLTEETIVEASLQADGNRLSGMRVTDGWVLGQHIYFDAEFSQPFESIEIPEGRNIAVVTFANNGTPIEARVGLSTVSVENARLNRETETTGLSFDQIASQSFENWNDALSVITVEGGTDREMRNFYSALYHTMMAPNLTSDVNGQYRRNDNTVATLPQGRRQFATLSLWDTYRAWHPLMTLINPQLVCDMVNSMLDVYDATGLLPVWPLSSGETDCMIGYHSASVIADAYMKGLRCFDADKALEALVASTVTTRKGADLYARLGFIPSNSKRESVSCTLEYCYDDWCIARMAEAMGRDSIAAVFYDRARNYANVFDGSTAFFRGKRSDGNWQRLFNLFAVSRDMTEATPWQYRFAAVHDVDGMINLHGGVEAFTAALDSLFSVTSEVEGELGDLTGLIGQYAHGNEPSHHMAYLYNFIGQPWKTQQLTRRLLDEMYQPTPDGICGNEDCGQMSAWYVLSSLGLYPVAPGSNEFALTTPLFPKATMRLADDKTLVITANNPARNRYIKSVTLNGREIPANFITWHELMEGGELKFTLTDKPVTDRGTAPEAAPYSLSKGKKVSTPFIDTDVYLFEDSVTVALGCKTSGAEIRYTLDGTEPTAESSLYVAPIVIDSSLTIKAVAFKPDYEPSATLSVDATKAVNRPALAVAKGANGVNYRYYEGLCETTADILSGTLLASGVIPEPAIDGAKADDHFAFIFSGLIDVPATGVYTFRTTTDDGSVLLIDGETVVNNDGGHAAVSATGMIPLQAGLHRFELRYFEDYEGQDFAWDWRLPGAAEFTFIPTTRLYTGK